MGEGAIIYAAPENIPSFSYDTESPRVMHEVQSK